MTTELPVYPRVPTWGRGHLPRCQTLVMQPTPDFAVVTADFASAIAYLAALDDPKPHIEMVAKVWHTEEWKVWTAIHAARKAS